MTIPFSEHWEMNKWNCHCAFQPEIVGIRIRDTMESIVDQSVNHIIYFLWKVHVYITYHRETNSDNEDGVYCDIMSSEWARKTLEDILKIDPNGLLLPMILYANGVSI